MSYPNVLKDGRIVASKHLTLHDSPSRRKRINLLERPRWLQSQLGAKYEPRSNTTLKSTFFGKSLFLYNQGAAIKTLRIH
jgi:hypothetical protein